MFIRARDEPDSGRLATVSGALVPGEEDQPVLADLHLVAVAAAATSSIRSRLT